MKKKTMNTILIVGGVIAAAAVAYVVLKPRTTTAYPRQTYMGAYPATGSLPCSPYDEYGFGTRCF